MTKQLCEGSFHLMGGEFTHAGAASSELKTILTGLGISADLVRRAAIATFEAEMNVIIHAAAGVINYSVTPDKIQIVVSDMGPGIPDIELAMTEGYSTAPDWVREMGWGAGMGLPNIKKNSDELRVESVVGEGTTIEIIISKKEGDACEGE
ncbi:MAG TPA: ATP-binding protein [Thermodesulfovibrionales bacterium]|nr:ATP-binding protein [Thermodesulfovibrionales bacterium]